MAVTLDDGTSLITLPEDTQWANEFDWQPVDQDRQYSLTGALVLQEGVRQKGREILLRGGEDAAWIPRTTVQALYSMAAQADKTLTLRFHAASFSVRFDRTKTALEAREVLRQANPGPTHLYSFALNLIEV